MDLFIDRALPTALSVQLYEQVRDAILDRRLSAGDQMSPTRQLAIELGIARHTVTTAFGRLTAEGFLVGRAGGGSVVAETAPAAAPRSHTRRGGALRPVQRLIGWDEREMIDGSEIRYDMRPGRPGPAVFPFDEWRREVARAAGSPVPGVDRPVGTPRLRTAIAQWVGRTRSIVADQESIVVTTGVQHAIDVVSRVLLSPGDVVAVEEPGFIHIRPLFRALGVQVVGVDVDDEGLVVDQIPDRARLVFVTPSHQYPLGVTMSLERRRMLLSWAERHRAAILEDDFECEYRYVDRPLEPLQRLDRHGHVIYVGSFWKTMSPAVRVGYAVVPDPLIHAVSGLLDATDCGPSPTIQLALARFIDSGELDRHVRRAKRIYQRRHRLLADSLDSSTGGVLGGLLMPIPSNSGLHLSALLDPEVDEADVLVSASRSGLAVSGLSRHYAGQRKANGLVLGFGSISESDLPEAIDVLADAILRERA